MTNIQLRTLLAKFPDDLPVVLEVGCCFDGLEEVYELCEQTNHELLLISSPKNLAMKQISVQVPPQMFADLKEAYSKVPIGELIRVCIEYTLRHRPFFEAAKMSWLRDRE